MGLRIPSAGRGLGLHIVGLPGTGKSYLIGRKLCVGDFDNGVPLVLLDPLGGSIDNFLDALIRRPPAVQKELGKRLVVVDMGGLFDHVSPWPLYYRRTG